MLYVSPFQELGLEADGNLDKASLNLAKKRLLAELDLSEKPTILRGAMELTKNDIINQFDKLASLKNWDFHRLIAVDKALLDFLQHKYWIVNNSLKEEPQYNNEAFIEFVSPYFLMSYKSLIIKCLTTQNTLQLKSVLKITPRLLTDDDHDDALFSVESYLDGWKDNLNEMAEEVQSGHVYNDSEVKPFYDAKFIECLNLLPDDFSWFRDSYATSLYNISAYTWNKENYYRAIDMVKYAQLLDISDETDKMLQTRIAWFDEQMKTLNKPEETNWGTIVRVVLFFIFFITKVATCDPSTSPAARDSSTPAMVYAPSSENIAALSTIDSLMNQIVKERQTPTDEPWDKKRFDTMIHAITQSGYDINAKVKNSLLIGMALKELQKMQEKTPTKGGITVGQINTLIDQFKGLKKAYGVG